MNSHGPTAGAYDVVVIGGAFSGAAFATLLRRWQPESRVVVVERSERFRRRVGEATVEVSGFFVSQVLRLHDYLAREQLSKQGLRYWFTDRPDRPLGEMSEVGSSRLASLPSFLLDRAKLDEHLLKTAREEGSEVLRPARVLDVEHDWPTSRVTVETATGERQITARWVIDASGRHAFLARRRRLRQREERHPVAAAWARWTEVADLDGTEVLGANPEARRLPALAPARRLATNHFCGYGWWCWMIPLPGGETSVGLVYNKELFVLPGDGTLQERYRAFVKSQAGMRELLESATMDEDDFLAYSHLPYRTTRYSDRGWALVGDAASFLDPYYSPGLDHASISIFATALLVRRHLAGELDDEALDAAIEEHNGNFDRSYDRWLEALYLGKYELMGDAELVGCAFLVDTALYHLGVVTPIYEDVAAMVNPLFGLANPRPVYAYRMMRTFNRRLVKLARLRRRAGTYGERNLGHRIYVKGFGLGAGGALRPLAQGLRIWLRMEVRQWWDRLRHGRQDVSRPVPAVSFEKGS